MFRTLTQPVTRLLTTLDAARDEAQDLAADISDARVLRYIARTSALINSALSLYALGTYEETLSPNGRGEVVLAAAPVASIVSINDGTTDLDLATYVVDAASGVLRPVNSVYNLLDTGAYDPLIPGIGVGAYPYAYSFPLPVRQLVVTYTGGWVLPGQDGANLPADIESVCIDLVVQSCADAGRNPAIMQESQEGTGFVRYFDAKKDNYATPPELSDLIARYAPIRF